MTRYLDRIAGVWEAISKAEGFDMVGFCLDTCHAHAGGNPLETVVEDVRKITGRIDLVHCNDSRDEFDSGADRHANFGAGKIDPDLLAARGPRRRGARDLRDARRGRRSTPPTSRGCASGSEQLPGARSPHRSATDRPHRETKRRHPLWRA